MVDSPVIEEFQIQTERIKLLLHEDVWAPTAFARLFAHLLDSAIRPGQHVLEIGVGSGVLAIFAGLKGATVVGTDINPAALDLCAQNWELNRLCQSGQRLLESNLFDALESEDTGSFDVLWCNAPTFPGQVARPENRIHYEQAGDDGRHVVDSIISGGGQYLKPGGTMFTVVTSKQGWNKTEELMNRFWSHWEVAIDEDLVLADHYFPFIDYWLKREQADGEQRIYKKDGRWHQRLRLLAARR